MLKIVIIVSLLSSCLGKNEYKNNTKFDGRIVGGVARIVGGTTTDIARHPYQVSLEFNHNHRCGGSIMNHVWVITAAHCVAGFPTPGFAVRVGSTYIGRGGSIHFPRIILIHPSYGQYGYDSDIAVIQVFEPFVYSDTVKPIPLTTQEPSGGTPVLVTGWGSSVFQGPPSDILQKVNINIIERNKCQELYNTFPERNRITQNMICAGVSEGGQNACSGDSGGPLAAGNQLVGIVSWGQVCGDKNAPAVYTNVAVFRGWVSHVTGVWRKNHKNKNVL